MKKPWSKKQLLAIDLLANCEYKTLKEVWNTVGCSERTLNKWRKDPKFMEHVISTSRQILKDTLPDVYSTLMKSSKSGSFQHIKIMLEHLDKLDEQKKLANENSITFVWKQKTVVDEDKIEEEE